VEAIPDLQNLLQDDGVEIRALPELRRQFGVRARSRPSAAAPGGLGDGKLVGTA
jgi:hypothetical protein